MKSSLFNEDKIKPVNYFIKIQEIVYLLHADTVSKVNIYYTDTEN